MPPNQGAFNRAYGNLTRRNRVNRMLQNKKKPGLTRQKGSRNLLHTYGLKRFRFSNNTTANNKNTRAKVLPRDWPANVKNLGELKEKSNLIISGLTQEQRNQLTPAQRKSLENNMQKEFNELSPGHQNLVTSVSRFSGPFSMNYQRPFTNENTDRFTGIRRRMGRKWATNKEAREGKRRVNYGPEEAKMMANLTAQYNNPEDMMVAVANLNLNDNVKEQFMMNIASMYR